MCGLDYGKMTKKEHGLDTLIQYIYLIISRMNEYGYKNLRDVCAAINITIDSNGNIDYHCGEDTTIINTIDKITSRISFDDTATTKSSGTNSLKTSKAYINLWEMFCINIIGCHYNETDKINAYFVSMGIDTNDTDKCRDFMFQWFIDELVAVHSDLNSALLELKALKQSSTPNPTPGSFTIDSGTIVACLEQDKQKLEARLAKANAALKAAGLEEV
jgi:hypothetical protein